MHRGWLDLLKRSSPGVYLRPVRNSVSPGMVAIVFMLHLCDEVTLYEMVPSSNLTAGEARHYWDDPFDAKISGAKGTDPKMLESEYAFWNRLAIGAGSVP